MKPFTAETILAYCLRRRKWTARYRKGLLDADERLQLLQDVKAFSRAWLRDEAERFVGRYVQQVQRSGRGVQRSSELPEIERSLREQAGRFFGRVKSFVRESIVAGVMGLLGPRALTSDELQQAERAAQVQDAYLDRFRAAMNRMPVPFSPEKTTEITVSPPPITPQQFIARAEMYGTAVWGAAQQIARNVYRTDHVYEEERRVLGRAEHCETCVKEAGKGWVPIGVLRKIGDSECGANCACTFHFRTMMKS